MELSKREKRQREREAAQRLADATKRNDFTAIYRELHASPKMFQGRSIRVYVPRIAELVNEYQPARMLDYGCGKGMQYSELKVQDAWGGMVPSRFDIGVEKFAKRPKGKFGGIICTDMMEHVDEPDVDKVLADIFSFAEERAFVLFGISVRPTYRKMLPDGRNLHVCIREPAWWDAKLQTFWREGLLIDAHYDSAENPK